MLDTKIKNLTSKANKLIDKNWIYLLIILLLAALMRIIWLDKIPNGFFLDEASNGYDAYSLFATGRDRYGNFLPIFLRAFEDYREALYIYFMIPFIKVFGLNEFATRLLSAVIGIITVFIIYLLAQELFNQKVGLVSALFLALNPWHIHYSRIGFRAILLPCLFSLALFFFVKSLKKPSYLIWSGLTFGFSLYTYSSARLFVPLFLLGLCIIFWRHFWINKDKTLIGFLLFLPIFIILFTVWITPEGMSRASNIGGFQMNPIKLSTNYLSYFDPGYLFFNGVKDPRMNAPHLSQLYDFEIVTVITGIIYLFRGNIAPTTRNILLLWLALYPLPGALLEPHHSIRSIVGVPLFVILSAYGAIQLINLFKLPNRKKLLWFISITWITASLAILTQLYFIDYPLKITKAWQYGMREAILYGENKGYNCIIMARQENQVEWLFESQSFSIFIPFYTQYPPQKYQEIAAHYWKHQKEKIDNSIWQKPVYHIGKYTLMPLTTESKLSNQCLYIIPSQVVLKNSGEWKEVHTVKDANNREHFKLYEQRL